MLNEIIRFKIHVQQSLEGYEDFVAQEVDKEMEEAERAEAGGAPLQEVEEPEKTKAQGWDGDDQDVMMEE